MVLARAPLWSSALQSGSHVTNYHRVYGGADTHYFAMSFAVWGIKIKLANGISIRVWSTICSEPELPGITLESGIKESSTIISVHPVSCSTYNTIRDTCRPNACKLKVWQKIATCTTFMPGAVGTGISLTVPAAVL